MKCTDCNKEVKPVVAVDIDGTMGMYHKHFLEFASGYLNKPVWNHYVGNQPFKEWFCTTYGCTIEVWHDIKLAYRQGSLKRTMPVYNEARYLCENIRAMGVELWVTTTRPYIRHDNIDPDTREWLKRHNIPYDYLIYDGEKYKKLAQLVGKQRVVSVVDDLYDEIMEAHNIFGPGVAILRHNNYNRAYTYSTKVNDLVVAGRIIRYRVQQWKEKHDGADAVRRNDQRDPADSSSSVQEEVK